MTDFTETSVPVPCTNSQIPVDLFVSKKHPGLPRGELGFVDSSGNTVYKVTRQSLTSSSNKRVLLDAAGNPLFALCRNDKGCWQGYKGADSTCDFKVKGFPYQRSCTIYVGNDIVAQTSLMYKLHQLFPKRGKFRLTIFPGSVHHALLAALIVIFLD
ncbi:protein LURP-one-related 7 [Prunus yedoensis var. nudiflora]|uniref:Protein LURP-one-related 7 n=1 Tax=Prunus yedoensis var. nudiflora TaxID=2094558 RepID=A0A314ZPJ1_PRUYE|nr:protein LURP-one-related 7 [Prunus yedoensis var. nudiflora]